MKITKSQLRRIIRESFNEGRFSDMDIEAMEQGTGRYAAAGPELPSKEDDDYEDDEYERGYQAGLDGIPPADSATTAYDAGYEDGSSDLHLPVPIEDYMGPDPTPEEVAENERLMQRQEPWKHN